MERKFCIPCLGSEYEFQIILANNFYNKGNLTLICHVAINLLFTSC